MTFDLLSKNLSKWTSSWPAMDQSWPAVNLTVDRLSKVPGPCALHSISSGLATLRYKNLRAPNRWRFVCNLRRFLSRRHNRAHTLNCPMLSMLSKRWQPLQHEAYKVYELRCRYYQCIYLIMSAVAIEPFKPVEIHARSRAHSLTHSCMLDVRADTVKSLERA